MNKATILLVLIRSMTKAEKRFLKLYSNLQDGDKVYLRLFDLMKECSSVEETARRFGREAEKCSFEIAVKHLYKVVIECLLHLRGRDSIRSRISDCLSEAGNSVPLRSFPPGDRTAERSEGSGTPP